MFLKETKETKKPDKYKPTLKDIVDIAEPSITMFNSNRCVDKDSYLSKDPLYGGRVYRIKDKKETTK